MGTLSESALRLPPADSDAWRLEGRRRQGETLSNADDLRIAEGLAFPSHTGVLETLARALAEDDSAHALVGGLAVGALTGRPRATLDADLLLYARDVGGVLNALEQRFGPLDIERGRRLVRVAAPAVDLLLADELALRRQTLAPENLQRVEIGAGRLQLPTHESAVILKYAAVVSPTRSAEDSAQDIADLTRLVCGQPDLDIDRVVELVRVLRFRSPKEIVQIVETLRAGGAVAVTRRAARPKITCVMP